VRQMGAEPRQDRIDPLLRLRELSIGFVDLQLLGCVVPRHGAES
jgi:hypothetical protein